MPRLLPDSESVIETPRLKLVPQTERHAAAMFPVLKNPELYRFAGGAPPISQQALSGDFRYLERRRSPDGSELWLNWIIELQDDRPIGYVQATLSDRRAVIAWVVGLNWQGRGFATEAAFAMKNWIHERYRLPIHACVNPRHAASERVAEKIGLSRTETLVEGERLWTSPPASD